MQLIPLLLIGALSLSPAAAQSKQPTRDRDKAAKPSREHVLNVIQKRKAFRAKLETRQRSVQAKFDTARTVFESKQRSSLEESNKKVLERITRGG